MKEWEMLRFNIKIIDNKIMGNKIINMEISWVINNLKTSKIINNRIMKSKMISDNCDILEKKSLLLSKW